MIMKNFIELVKKYKIHILFTLFFIFFMRSCIKSGQVGKLKKVKTSNEKVIDSLNNLINGQRDTINNISEVIRQEKLKVHRDYDNYISSKDRGEQLMELHMVVKKNIKEIEK
jgi:hypothetical protein